MSKCEGRSRRYPGSKGRCPGRYREGMPCLILRRSGVLRGFGVSFADASRRRGGLAWAPLPDLRNVRRSNVVFVQRRRFRLVQRNLVGLRAWVGKAFGGRDVGGVRAG